MKKPIRRAEHSDESDQIGEGFRPSGAEERLPWLWPVGIPFARRKINVFVVVAHGI